MKKINFQNNITKVNKATFDEFQNNIEESCVAVSPTQPETNEKVWIQKGKNLFNSNLIIRLVNCTNNNGTIKQNEADTNSNLTWKIQTFKDGVFISNPMTLAKNDIGKISLTFIKLSTFNEVAFGLNGYKIDTLLVLNVSKLIDGETYTISFETTNVTQGSISWKKIQLEQGSAATEYEEYTDKKIWCKNDNGVYEEFINIEDIKGSNWTNLELKTNWENLGGQYFPAQYKKIGNQIFLRGIIQNNTEVSKVLLQVPESIRPKKVVYSCINMYDTFLSSYIDTYGVLNIANYTVGYWIDLSNFNYFID